MTEQPDTATCNCAGCHAHAKITEFQHLYLGALKDLDAARAERDEARKVAAARTQNEAYERQRAEAAEALVVQLQEVAEHCHVLEARCANAQELCDGNHQVAEVPRALTGGTE